MTTTTPPFDTANECTLNLTTAEADAIIETLPYPRVTKQAIEAKIASRAFVITEKLLTICIVTMRNGFEVVGTSACADKRNYNREVGKRLAYEAAFEKLWPLEGYLLRDTIWKADQYLPEQFVVGGSNGGSQRASDGANGKSQATVT